MPLSADVQSLRRVAAFMKGIRGKMDAGLKAGLKMGGSDFQKRFTKDRLSGPRPEKLGRMTGALARSTAFLVVEPGKAASVRPGLYFFVGRGAPYARAHEPPPLGTAGQRITPKKGRWLAIPFKSLISKKPYPFKSPREETGLVFVMSKLDQRKAYLVREGKGKTELVWLLLRSVKTKPRLWLAKDWQAFRPYLTMYLRDRTAKALSTLGSKRSG